MKKLPPPAADTPTLSELRSAFMRLSAETQPRWGKMGAAQMTKHCRSFVDLYMGSVPVAWPVRFIARLIGPSFLRKTLVKSPRATPKNMRTMPAIRVDPTCKLDLEPERTRLFEAFDAIERLSGQVEHPLYGSMFAEDVSALVRHHTAHHANQFGLLTADRQPPA